MARKCKKNDKNPPLRCVLAGFAHLGAEVGGALVEGVGHRAGQLKAKDKLKKGEELSKEEKRSLGIVGSIPHSLVGNKKLGHGGFCHANKIKKKEGSRVGGEGLKRVGKPLA